MSNMSLELNNISLNFEYSILNKSQQLILENLYNKLRPEVILIIVNIKDKELIDFQEVTIAILYMITLFIKSIEKFKINSKYIQGADKKIIVLELGRQFLINELKYSKVKDIVVSIYNSHSESILENIIDTSKSVNTIIKHSNLFSCCY